MSHLPILPILIPLLTGALLLLLGARRRARQRQLGLAASLTQLLLAMLLVRVTADGTQLVYALGNWAPPFGIVLVLDRLAALMLLVTAVVALPALLYATAGADRRGRYFHALFQLQLLGVNGAFLTGDLFNLFVFFEILLIASYALLLHGRTSHRIRAAIPYLVLNLTGSALFLIGTGTLFGLSGTLNMADLAVFLSVAEGDTARLAAAAGMILLIVFSLKAALVPLHGWLPGSYGAAAAPVAALFAIMTKVGVYALLRLSMLLFGSEAGEVAQLLQPWLWPLALVTIAVGACGALAAPTLSVLVAWLVIVSVGTLVAGLAIGTPEATAATLYYLMHTTWVSAALFLLAGVIDQTRGGMPLNQPGPALRYPRLIGTLFFLGAIAVVGLPPLSGFIGKVLLMQATPPASAPWLWSLLLGSTLVLIVALSRAGSTLFWRPSLTAPVSATPLARRLTAVGLLLSVALALALGADPIYRTLAATASEIHTPALYSSAVLSVTPVAGGE
ncbi:MAG: monovalent cation/H+ antiporter subunit D [Spongiibacteraceae bacterium]|jgi:multicomponent K+:H+ antiporter subunit D|nr:monovalent cation/H+ antiporter subunit D [Spongiibacteraceae bacterium]